MKVGIAADHAGLDLKDRIAAALAEAGHDVEDYGPYAYDPDDDYPDYVIPLAEHVAISDVERGICVCGSGIGAAIAADKVPGARAAVIMDPVSARAAAEDNGMNVICLGARFVEFDTAVATVNAFLDSHFAHKPRRERQIERLAALERGEI